MSFRTDTTPDEAYTGAKQRQRNLKKYANKQSAEFQSGANVDDVLDVMDTLLSYETKFNEFKAVPGLTDYARGLLIDPTDDIVADLDATLADLDVAIDAILAAAPVDAQGFAQNETPSRSGRVRATIVGVNLVAVRNALDAVANGIG